MSPAMCEATDAELAAARGSVGDEPKMDVPQIKQVRVVVFDMTPQN